MSWVAGAAVAVVVLLARGPGGRPVRRVVRPRAAGPRSRTARGRTETGRVRELGLAMRLPQRRRGAGEDDLALLVTDVASRLRAGADPAAAWRSTLGRSVPPTGPTIADLSSTAASRSQAAVVVAAGRLAADLGTALAPLLDGVAEQLAAEAEAEGERRAALAGPRATGQVLTWLPLLGVLLGVAVGADPLAVLLDGSFGSVALVVGVTLLLVGRGWTSRLARHAAAAGREP